MSNSQIYTDHTVAVYPTHEQAEAAIKTLTADGCNIRQLSIIGQNFSTEEQPVGFINTGERMLSWGKYGAFWGSIWGLFFGSAMMFIPGLGTLMFAGWLVGMLEGAVVGGGLAALAGALVSLGIPKDTVIDYQRALKTGSFLVLAHGDSAEVNSVRTRLEATNPTRIDNYTTLQPVGATH